MREDIRVLQKESPSFRAVSCQMQMFEISDLLATCLEDKEVSDLQEKVNQMQLLEAATLAKQLYRQLSKEK